LKELDTSWPDACDSAVLARFGEMIKPAHWQPAPSKARALRALLTRRDVVAQDLQRERNRCEALVIEDTPERVRQSLTDTITFLEQELQALQKSIDEHIDDDPDLKRIWDLLQSIPGVGQRGSWPPRQTRTSTRSWPPSPRSLQA